AGEGVVGNGDIGLASGTAGLKRAGGLHAVAAVVVDKGVGVDGDVGKRFAGDGAIGVHSAPAVAAGIIVVGEIVVLDEGGVAAAVVCQKQPGHVVLHDAVDDVRAGMARRDH